MPHFPMNSSTFNTIDRNRKEARGEGIHISNICEICGKPKTRGPKKVYSHVTCSKKKQKLFHEGKL